MANRPKWSRLRIINPAPGRGLFDELRREREMGTTQSDYEKYFEERSWTDKMLLLFCGAIAVVVISVAIYLSVDTEKEALSDYKNRPLLEEFGYTNATPLFYQIDSTKERLMTGDAALEEEDAKKIGVKDKGDVVVFRDLCNGVAGSFFYSDVKFEKVWAGLLKMTLRVKSNAPIKYKTAILKVGIYDRYRNNIAIKRVYVENVNPKQIKNIKCFFEIDINKAASFKVEFVRGLGKY